ncbi:MAG: hypothetical protein WDO73_12985 [Ignavibacteriota bacterium]
MMDHLRISRTHVDRANPAVLRDIRGSDEAAVKIIALAGTAKSTAILLSRFGAPSCQPSGNRGGAGATLRSPAGAPAATQRASTAISLSVRRRSSRKWGVAGSHGGIARFAVIAAMTAARLEASR